MGEAQGASRCPLRREAPATARRDGDGWVLEGAKWWIGNATFADLVIVWARDVATGQVLGFVVEKDTPGFTATKIENKIALRIVQNADIVFAGFLASHRSCDRGQPGVRRWDFLAWVSSVGGAGGVNTGTGGGRREETAADEGD